MKIKIRYVNYDIFLGGKNRLVRIRHDNLLAAAAVPPLFRFQPVRTYRGVRNGVKIINIIMNTQLAQ